MLRGNTLLIAWWLFLAACVVALCIVLEGL